MEALLNFVEDILNFMEAILNLVKTKSTPRFDLDRAGKRSKMSERGLLLGVKNRQLYFI